MLNKISSLSDSIVDNIPFDIKYLSFFSDIFEIIANSLRFILLSAGKFVNLVFSFSSFFAKEIKTLKNTTLKIYLINKLDLELKSLSEKE